jgi:hypothetical protein
MADQVAVPSAQDFESALSPLSGVNMFAPATQLTNLMANQASINEAIQRLAQAKAINPIQTAAAQNQLNIQPQTLQAGLESTQAGTAQTQASTQGITAGLLSNASANQRVHLALNLDPTFFKDMSDSQRAGINQSIDNTFDPTDNTPGKVKTTDIDTFVKDLVAAANNAKGNALIQSFNARVERMFSRFGPGGKLLTAGYNTLNAIKALGAPNVNKQVLDNAISVLNEAMGASGSGNTLSYDSLYGSIKGTLSYIAGLSTTQVTAAMQQDLVNKLSAIHQQLGNALGNILSGFDSEALRINNPDWASKKASYLATFNGNAAPLDVGNANPATPASAGLPPGWSITAQ